MSPGFVKNFAWLAAFCFLVAMSLRGAYLVMPEAFKWAVWPAAGWQQVNNWRENLVENGYIGRDCILQQDQSDIILFDPEIRACLFDMTVVAERAEPEFVYLVERCEVGDRIVERSLASFRRGGKHSYSADCAIGVLPQSQDMGIGKHSEFWPH